MKVLIADFDIFQRIGGGQTFYRGIIENNVKTDFYYFTIQEPRNAVRPENAHNIPFKEFYFRIENRIPCDLNIPEWIYEPFIKANNIAASVVGQHFDVVDLPDYEQFGILLRPALHYHNVSFERIVLSMHGRLSTTIRLNWSTEGQIDRMLELQEEMQYRTVDTRYGISKTYLGEWQEIANLESHCLDPLWHMSLPKPTLDLNSNDLPNINFVGRTEKRKGPDIFVELATWLPRSIFSTANIIGPQSYDPSGIGSAYYLYTMIQNRLRDIHILPEMSANQLVELFASKSMTFLPSRYDTFNLLALESLFSGCPTAIGTGAGVCEYLKERFPKVPFIPIDIKNIYTCLPSIHSVLQNYNEYRHRLVDAVAVSDFEPISPGLKEIYETIPAYDDAIRQNIDRWYFELMMVYHAANIKRSTKIKARVVNFVKSHVSPNFYPKLYRYRSLLRLDNLKIAVKRKLISTRFGSYFKSADQLVRTRSLYDKYMDIFKTPELSREDINNKLKKCLQLGSEFRIDRVRLLREMARLERIRGNGLIAASYLIRVMRLLGKNHFGDLEIVKRILVENGFELEARAADSMYGAYPDQVERCGELLNQALENNRHNEHLDYEFLDDRRKLFTYRASVIVSLYNAATKLPKFLEMMRCQAMINACSAEIILIDSGSGGDDYAMFKRCMKTLNIPIVYARCARRETIQKAWNRGIGLARSPYLTFLGVDEVIVPDCLEVLAAELDADSALDWVVGNSLVTNVNATGDWVNDIMLYNRSGYKQDLVYLETCYLSWVGGLYRRSIHDRFGFYDPTFGAAGDTEFKNRILPFIKTKAIPRTLGTFWNYPEERTTQSPRAEIEDLRAWYLHRTLAGVKYAFIKRDPAEAEDLFYMALRYRKSYCQHWSTDVEYAYNLGSYLLETVPSSPILKYLDGVKRVLNTYRSLDWLASFSPSASGNAIIRAQLFTARVSRRHRILNNHAVAPPYKVFNDNRYEQHANFWSTVV